MQTAHGRNYKRLDIMQLFRFIDWIMTLSEELEHSFCREIRKIEKEKTMRYVTSVERISMKKGMEQGIIQGIQQGIQQGMQRGLLEAIEMVGLSLKFGADGLRLLPTIQANTDTDQLTRLKDVIKSATSLDEVDAALAAAGQGKM